MRSSRHPMTRARGTAWGTTGNRVRAGGRAPGHRLTSRLAESSAAPLNLRRVIPSHVAEDRGHALVASPKQVVQAGDGVRSPEGLVSAAMVVVPEPAVKGCGAFGA